MRRLVWFKKRSGAAFLFGIFLFLLNSESSLPGFIKGGLSKRAPVGVCDSLRRWHLSVALLDSNELPLVIAVIFLGHNSLVNVSSSLVESFLHIVCETGARLKKGQIILTREFLCFIVGNLPLACEVRLVANQHHWELVVAALLNVFEPPLYVIEAVPASDIVHQNAADGASVVGPGNWSKRFLACCVPNLQLHVHPTVDLDDPACELNSNGQVMSLFELALAESEQKTRLSHRTIAHYDELEGVGILACLHFCLFL